MKIQISVVIPLYNKRDSISRALESVFAQTVQPLDIIVVNDGSTDGSEQFVEDICHPLIKLIHQSNAGVSAARNKGIESAQGDWIAFLDADDEWKPEFLETMQMLFLTFPHCKVLACAYELQDHQGHRKPIILGKIPFKGEYGILSNYFEVACCSYPPMCSSAVMVDKDILQSIGGFPVGIKSGEDLLTWARLAVKYKIAYSIKTLSIFMLDISHHVSNRPSRLPDIYDYVGDELKKLFDNSDGKLKSDLKKYLSLWYKMRASVYLRKGDRLEVWKYSFKSLNYNLLNYKNYLFIAMSLMPQKVQKMIAKIYTA